MDIKTVFYFFDADSRLIIFFLVLWALSLFFCISLIRADLKLHRRYVATSNAKFLLKKMLVFLHLLFLFFAIVSLFELSHPVGLIILALFIIFPYMYYRFISFAYRKKPVRRFFVYLLSILFFPIVIPYFILLWIFNYGGLKTMYVDYEPIEIGDDDGGDDMPFVD